MTRDEAIEAHRKRFGEWPPLIPEVQPEKLIALVEEALNRGRPVEMADLLRDDPELLAQWKTGHVIF